MKVLVYDFGLFTEAAARLVRDGAEVFYYVPWGEAFPKSNKAIIGENFDGLKRILNFWEYVDEVDLFYFPDTHCGDLVEYLKQRDYMVAGVGQAEKLELDRWYGRQIQEQVGLPTQNTRKIKGLNALNDLLQKEKNLFIKLNIFRGDVESFRHSDYDSSKPLLDHLQYELGPKAEYLNFIVEEEIDGLEPGLDGIVFEGDNLSPCMLGYEKKGCGYIGSVMPYDEVPKQLKDVNDALVPVFEEMQTRFFFSTEVMVPNETQGYLIDYTLRHAAPTVSAIQTELIENYGDVIYGLASGEKIQPIMSHRYAAAVAIESDWADKHWLKVNVPDELRQWFKFRMACSFDNNYYALPGFCSLGSMVVLGDSVEEVVDTLKERAEEVKAYQININTSKFEEIQEDIQRGEELGISF